MKPKPEFLRLHPRDPVVVALRDLVAGELVDGVTCAEAVPFGHKMATREIGVGDAVLKFGQFIGTATQSIASGEWVHTHNLVHGPSSLETASSAEVVDGQLDRRGGVGESQQSTAEVFQGFLRPDGRVGTRNLLGILTTVNCSATVAKLIGREVERRGLLDDFDNVDGLAVLTHASGCGLVPSGDGLRNLQRTLGGYARHPNFGGVLIIGLGCETNDLASLYDNQELEDSGRLRSFAIQNVGGTAQAVEAGIVHLLDLALVANDARRESRGLEDLCLALQCGGSDAFSALTANPALGVAADAIVAAGGRVLLAETPEIYGAEHLLLARVENRKVAETLHERLSWWQAHAAQNGGELDNNPSPGNKDGGLTTILEKSLGAVAKGGSSTLRGVLDYAEPCPGPGLWFMDSPGFDPCSATGEIAAGANLLCFTTGRGSVSGFLPTPCVKLSSNSALAGMMSGDIDFDCGGILEGLPIQDCGRQVLDLLVAVASGKASKSEQWGFGESEFIPWVPGAVF